MTVAPQRPILAAPDVSSVLGTLRAHGHRISAPRRQVVEALFAAVEPATAEEIASGLDGRRTPVDPASVYANLELLAGLGLVRHVHLGHGPARWMFADRERSEFLRCEACGDVRALPPSQLAEVRAAIIAATGYRARFDHFPIVGLCSDCHERGAG